MFTIGSRARRRLAWLGALASALPLGACLDDTVVAPEFTTSHALGGVDVGEPFDVILVDPSDDERLVGTRRLSREIIYDTRHSPTNVYTARIDRAAVAGDGTMYWVGLAPGSLTNTQIVRVSHDFEVDVFPNRVGNVAELAAVDSVSARVVRRDAEALVVSALNFETGTEHVLYETEYRFNPTIAPGGGVVGFGESMPGDRTRVTLIDVDAATSRFFGVARGNLMGVSADGSAILYRHSLPGPDPVVVMDTNTLEEVALGANTTNQRAVILSLDRVIAADFADEFDPPSSLIRRYDRTADGFAGSTRGTVGRLGMLIPFGEDDAVWVSDEEGTEIVEYELPSVDRIGDGVLEVSRRWLPGTLPPRAFDERGRLVLSGQPMLVDDHGALTFIDTDIPWWRPATWRDDSYVGVRWSDDVHVIRPDGSHELLFEVGENILDLYTFPSDGLVVGDLSGGTWFVWDDASKVVRYVDRDGVELLGFLPRRHPWFAGLGPTIVGRDADGLRFEPIGRPDLVFEVAIPDLAVPVASTALRSSELVVLRQLNRHTEWIIRFDTY